MKSRLDRFASFLDMYSSSLLPQCLSWALLLSAIGFIAVGAPSVSPLGVSALALLLWANRVRFLSTLDRLLERHGWLIVLLPLVFAGAGFIAAPPIAVDDLLRHIVAAQWPGGYADMYVQVDPAVRIGQPYWGFDLLAGKLGLWFGPRIAMWLIQLAAWGAFVVVFCIAGRRLVGHRPHAMALVMIALVLSLQIAGPRLFLARPEIFLTIWAISAAAVRHRAGGLVWLAAGGALVSSYYLAPIYFPAAILLPFRWRARVLALAGLCVIWALVWGAIEGSALPALLHRPFDALASQSEAAQISENASILGWLLSPTMLVLLAGAIASARRQKAGFLLVVLAAYFAMSNQLRFGATVAPLLALYALSGLGGAGSRLPRHSGLLVIVFSTVFLFSLAASIARDGSLPSFRLPDGAVVLTAFDDATFSLPFENPGRIRVAPIFDIGMVSPDARELVTRLAQGELDCDSARRQGFTHVVERSLALHAVPDCLELAATQRSWRMWLLR